MEPNIHPVDAAAFYASASISLRRIADSLERLNQILELEAKGPRNIADKLSSLCDLAEDKLRSR